MTIARFRTWAMARLGGESFHHWGYELDPAQIATVKDHMRGREMPEQLLRGREVLGMRYVR